MATIKRDDIVAHDPVNHPQHYQGKGGMEVLDVIEAFTDGLNGIEATDTGNILKYACRWKKKNGIEDLKKLVYYANHLIAYLEKKRQSEFFSEVACSTRSSANETGMTTAIRG